MNIQSLQCFLAVAECGSFSLAAQKIYMSQPAISHQIRGLEKELGVTLFQRGKGGISLTDVGRQCLDIAAGVVSGCEQMKALAARYVGAVAGIFSVGHANNRAGDVAMPALREMAGAYPDLTVQTQYVRAIPAVEALRRGELDMIVTSQQSVKGVAEIAYSVLLCRGLVAVVPADHPLSGNKSIRFADIQGETVIIKKRTSFPQEYDAFFAECREHGITFPQVLEAETTEDVFSQIQLGRGIGCLGGGLLRRHIENVRTIPLSDSRKEHGLAAAWRRDEQKPAVQEFLKYFAALR